MRPPERAYFERLVYGTLYPEKPQNDPQSFSRFVYDHLVPEIRLENIRFYGSENERGVMEDAMYPGHDYSTLSARTRLGDFPGHKRLFAVFDKLKLTPSDIHLLCIWEGTKSAKERYESLKGKKVVDTTWDSIATSAPSPRSTPTVTHHHRRAHSSSMILEQSPSPRRSRRSEIDYYGNVDIWSNSQIPTERRAEITENAFRESLAAGTSSRRASLRTVTPRRQEVVHQTPRDCEVVWNGWIRYAQGQGLHLPGGRENAALSSHIPAHYAYATPRYHYGPHSSAPGIFRQHAQILTPPMTPPRRHVVLSPRSPRTPNESESPGRRSTASTYGTMEDANVIFETPQAISYELADTSIPVSPLNRRRPRSMGLTR